MNILNNPQTKLILDVVENYTGTSFDELNVNCRKRKLVQNRQLIYYLHSLYTPLSTSTIGSIFNQDHANVIHARKTISDLIDTDKQFKELTDIIKKKITEKINIVKINKETKKSVFKSLLDELNIKDSEAKEWINRFEKAY